MNAYSEILKAHYKENSDALKDVAILAVKKVEVPTEPGWYFCLQPYQKYIFYVERSIIGLAVNRDGLISIIDEFNFPPESTEWYGPIPFPKRTILK